MLLWLFKRLGKCLNSNGSMIESRGPLVCYNASGAASLAVASSCREKQTRMNTNNPNFSMKRPKQYKSIIVDTTQESMNMTSTLENHICSMFKPKMKKSESSWKAIQERQHQKKPSYRSKQLGPNSMSWLLISIIQHQQMLYLVCITLLIANSNLKPSMSILKPT